jgi:hypothetical protein
MKELCVRVCIGVILGGGGGAGAAIEQMPAQYFCGY